ncbi:GlcG/HbpS family heme-binding protein [Ramlibacter rhizophilus]|uniref:Heme-binding protein n=1 Tax=Ramlibacter rhizophilus TaxID=1781167 RepID=A0A4Z0C1I7_9BURK|nr:heme-binding protein [Ramlibacter rhizophilus]TFZ04370.1 heme-binding protein [Ramlibacter rhizophilus]
MTRILIALTAALFAGGAAAQPATYTLKSITPEAALKAAQAALQSCSKSGYQIAVAVNDRGGHPLVVLRDRLAGAHTPETAVNKAWTALSFRMDTLAFAKVTQAGEEPSGIRHLPRVVAIGGGRMIEGGGAIVGAIGVSGAPGGEADDTCAKAGIAAIQDELDF